MRQFDQQIQGSIFDTRHQLRMHPQQVKSSVDQSAALFSKAGIGPGHLVSLVNDNSIFFLFRLWALWKIGATVFPIALHADPKLYQKHVEKYSPHFLIDEKGEVNGFQRDWHWQTPETILILESSGTSGFQKGICFNEDHLSFRIQTIVSQFQSHMQQSLCFLPLTFGHGLIANSLSPLAAGGNLILSRKFDIPFCLGFESTLLSHQVTYFSSVPAFWNMLAASGVEIKNNSLSPQIHCASEILHASTFTDMRKRFPNSDFIYHYGLTECASWVTSRLHPAGENDFLPGQVGKGMGVEIQIQNPEKGKGEILLRSRSIPESYLIGPNQFRKIQTESGWLATGDIGEMQDTELCIYGRAYFFINRGGDKISPFEIEDLVMALPDVQLCAAVAKPHRILGEVPVLFIQQQGNQTEEFYLQFLNRSLPKTKVPAEIHLIEKMPLSSNGKVDRKQLMAAIGSKR